MYIMQWTLPPVWQSKHFQTKIANNHLSIVIRKRFVKGGVGGNVVDQLHLAACIRFPPRKEICLITLTQRTKEKIYI